VDGALSGEVAGGDGGRHFGDVADLGGQVARHRVHRVGEVLPCSGDARDVGLATEPSLGADLARDARHFAREGVELVDHRVDGFLELQDFAGNADGDFPRQVATGNSRGHVGEVANLTGQD